jgi:hypothetical protein
MSSEHEIVFETDGRHSSTYLYEPPMGIRQYVEPIDEVLDLGVDTISYVVGDCSVLLYDTKVGERWGHNLDLCNHAIWYRAGVNAKMMIDNGHDPLQIVCDHAHKRGFQFLPHLLLNLNHVAHERVTDSRVADFTTDHPEWQIGPEPDVEESLRAREHQLSYTVPDVRKNRLAVIRELVGDYPTDGIEVNFFTYAPFIARKDVAEHTETMTEWVRQIRRACDEAAKAQGRTKRLVLRVGSTLQGNKAMGHDVEKWISEGLVDTLIAMPIGDGFEADTSGIRGIAKAVSATKTTLLAGLDSVASEQTHETHRAAAVNAYDAGVQGILIHRYYPAPYRYPYNDQMMQRLRLLAYPDVLAHQDKIFRITPQQQPASGSQFGVKEQLPQELKAGEEGTPVFIDVYDDLAEKERLGELWKCELRVMLPEMMHTDEIRITWNGKTIPDESIRKADWVFQMRPGRPNHCYCGYRFHVDLKGDMLPKLGRNEIRVDALKKDEKLVNPLKLGDIEIGVEYLAHRNALRNQEPYAASNLFTP